MIRTILALLLVSGAVQADTLYRCVGKGGAVSYQDRPCAPETRQTAATEFTPERVPVYRRPRDVPTSRPARASRSSSTRAAGAHIALEPATATCEAAKLRREKKLAQVGLKRTYGLLQKLDDEVRRACK